MKTSSAKAKGRRLQVATAEALSIGLGLKIAAEPPTKPGRRANGAVYVREDAPHDLRIRRMGQSGVDVILVSARAQRLCRHPSGDPALIECKNTEKWSLDAMWKTGGFALGKEWLIQTGDLSSGVVVFAKNHCREPLVFLKFSSWYESREWVLRLPVILRFPGRYMVTTLSAFTNRLRELAEI